MLGQGFINQQVAANDLIDAGDIASPNSAWEQVAIVNVTGTSLLVELSNLSNGKVYADSIRIQRIGDIPPPPAAPIQSEPINSEAVVLSPVKKWEESLLG